LADILRSKLSKWITSDDAQILAKLSVAQGGRGTKVTNTTWVHHQSTVEHLSSRTLPPDCQARLSGSSLLSYRLSGCIVARAPLLAEYDVTKTLQSHRLPLRATCLVSTDLESN
jgi:hypothetical protein